MNALRHSETCVAARAREDSLRLVPKLSEAVFFAERWTNKLALLLGDNFDLVMVHHREHLLQCALTSSPGSLLIRHRTFGRK